jgi:hypothetical protein
MLHAGRAVRARELVLAGNEINIEHFPIVGFAGDDGLAECFQRHPSAETVFIGIHLLIVEQEFLVFQRDSRLAITKPPVGLAEPRLKPQPTSMVDCFPKAATPQAASTIGC